MNLVDSKSNLTFSLNIKFVFNHPKFDNQTHQRRTQQSVLLELKSISTYKTHPIIFTSERFTSFPLQAYSSN